MSDVAIRVENLSKCYELGELVTMRDLPRVAKRAVTAPFRSLLGRNGDHADSDHGREKFWALKDINFEVKHGEVLGIIGRNGAGKSTLLKILSRITAPTTGRADVFGRVASLLEVGTGFHPELTGRENVYLNGTIMGMTRAEIDRKFDEIVDFAGVEQFIDTPVKRYSSGMGVRLGFAVAAHLDPEILIVDEVLAVGDAGFQQRCLRKMEGVTTSGKAVLFVSHNMASIEQLSSRCVLLDQGMVAYSGDPTVCIERYFNRSVSSGRARRAADLPRASWAGEREIEICEIGSPALVDGGSTSSSHIVFSLRLRARAMVSRARISATLYAQSGPLGTSFSPWIDTLPIGSERSYEVKVRNPGLAAGSYWFAISVGDGTSQANYQLYDVLDEVLHFQIGERYDGDCVIVGWHRGWGHLDLGPCAVTTRPAADQELAG